MSRRAQTKALKAKLADAADTPMGTLGISSADAHEAVQNGKRTGATFESVTKR